MDRKHVSVYFYPQDRDPLAGRPDGVKAGTWLIRLAEKHVEGRLRIPGIAPPSTEIGQKLSVSLSVVLHRQLQRLHPDTPVPDLLRTLALVDAGRVVHGPPVDEPRIAVPVRISASSKLQEGEDLDARVATLIRRARARTGTEGVVNAWVPAELVPALDRARGETSPAAFLENELVKEGLRDVARSLSDELDTSFPRITMDDPAAVAPTVRRLLTPQPTPPNVHIFHAQPVRERLVELALSADSGKDEVVLLVRSPDLRRDPDECRQAGVLSRVLLDILWIERVRCDVNIAHVELDGLQLWTFIRLTPRRTRGLRIGRRKLDPSARDRGTGRSD